MKKILASLIASLAIAVLVAPATVQAAGGNYVYVPLIKTPAPVKKTIKKTTPAKRPVQPSCDKPAAPAVDVYSRSENDVTQNPSGVWTLYLYTQQQTAQWVVYWNTSSGYTYDFEVSASPSVNKTTGKFTSPVAAYHLSGNTGDPMESQAMDISKGDTYYFHVSATDASGCVGDYSTVGQITAIDNQVVPSTTSSNGSGGSSAWLAYFTLVSGTAMAFAARAGGKFRASLPRLFPVSSR